MPVVTAVVVWLLLAGVALSPAAQAEARRHVSWMLDPLFHDWQVVRQGWEVKLAGGDPLAAVDQPFNYPRAVLLGAQLGGMRVPLVGAGLGLAAALLAGLGWILRPRSAMAALLAAAMMVSPPVLLIIERANLDAMSFLLVGAGVSLLARARDSQGTHLGGAALLTGAAAIKLYPGIVLLGAAFFWRGRRRGLVLLALTGLAIWGATHLEEITLILRKTTRGLEPAYGRMLAGSRYYVEELRPKMSGPEGSRILSTLMAWSLAGCGAAYAAAAIAGWMRRRQITAVLGRDRSAALFMSGALIFPATFLLGSNWSYRLVFLLLCLPALGRAMVRKEARGWAGAALAGIVVMMLAPFHLGLGWFLVRETVAWALAAGLLGAAVGLVTGGPGELDDPVCAPAGSK